MKWGSMVCRWSVHIDTYIHTVDQWSVMICTHTHIYTYIYGRSGICHDLCTYTHTYIHTVNQGSVCPERSSYWNRHLAKSDLSFAAALKMVQKFGRVDRFWRIPRDGQGVPPAVLPGFSATGLSAEAFFRWAQTAHAFFKRVIVDFCA